MPQRIKLRMKCASVTPDGANEAVVFTPVNEGRENESFHALEALPTAALSFTITHGGSKGAFQADQRYTVTIKPVAT
jgi:hypothetical protein